MPTSRSYGDACGIARALDVVGERWALLVVRELLLGPQRFSDLRRALPKAASNLVADRLRELEGRGVISRRTLPPPAGSQVYELTAWGRDLEPIVLARTPRPPRPCSVSISTTGYGPSGSKTGGCRYSPANPPRRMPVCAPTPRHSTPSLRTRASSTPPWPTEAPPSPVTAPRFAGF